MVGFMTHACGGCEGGAPCSSCGGNIPKSSPAYHALDFAMAMTEGIQDPYWRAVEVGQTVRTAPARSATPEWSAIESLVGRAHSVVTTPRDDCLFSLLTTGWGDPVTCDNPVEQPPVCCLLDFQYPVPVPEFGVEVDPTDGSRAQVYWVYYALAIYKKDGIDEATKRKCSCTCCRFKQLHSGLKHAWKAVRKPKTKALTLMPYAMDLSMPPFGKEAEDTTQTKDGPVSYGQGNAKLAYSDPPKNESWEYSTDDAEKLAGAPPALAPLIAERLKALKVDAKSVCIYYMRDKPGMPVAKSNKFKMDVCYHGEIHDTCRNDMIVKDGDKKFELLAEGYFWDMSETDASKVARKKNPAASPQFTFDIEYTDGPEVIPDCDKKKRRAK